MDQGNRTIEAPGLTNRVYEFKILTEFHHFPKSDIATTLCQNKQHYCYLQYTITKLILTTNSCSLLPK